MVGYPYPSGLPKTKALPDGWDYLKVSTSAIGNGSVTGIPPIYFQSKSGLNSTGTGVFEAQGSVLGITSRSSGKLHFEVAYGFVGTILPFDPFFEFLPHIQIGVSQAPNLTFGGHGLGCALTDDGSLRDEDTFGTVNGYIPSFTQLMARHNAFTIITVEIDLDANLIWFGLNGAMVGNPGAGTGGQAILAGSYYPCAGFPVNNTPDVLSRAFSEALGGHYFANAIFNTSVYTPSSGFSLWA